MNLSQAADQLALSVSVCVFVLGRYCTFVFRASSLTAAACCDSCNKKSKQLSSVARLSSNLKFTSKTLNLREPRFRWLIWVPWTPVMLFSLFHFIHSYKILIYGCFKIKFNHKFGFKFGARLSVCSTCWHKFLHSDTRHLCKSFSLQDNLDIKCT